MKTKVFSFLIGLTAIAQIASAQTTIYRMHVKMKNGSTHTVKADDVMEVYFTASQPYDPSHPVTADVESIHAPKEGGIYIVHINSNIPLSTNSGNPDNMVVDDYFSNFLNQAPVSLISNYEDGVLSITVNPTTNYIVNSRDVKLYDLEGTEAFSISVSQDGDPNATLIGDNGNAYISSMAQAMYNSHAKYRKADVEYTGLINLEGFKAPLDPYDYKVREIWYTLYQGINRNTALLQHCDGQGMDIFKPMCIILNALSYYDLVTFFGGVPYVTNTDYAMDPLPRTSPNEIFNTLIEQLKTAMGNMDDKVTGFVNSPEKMYTLSKDVARVLLANIYMYQGRYMEAKPLLEEIVNSNRYSLASAVDNLDPQCSEVIWSQGVDTPTRARANEMTVTYYNDYLCIYQTYSDVLLSLAECESKLNNDTKAKEYLNQVSSTKGIEANSSETIAAISEVRHRIQIDFGGYFAFLKRTGQAQSTLGIEEYQLLFPIPRDEINMNPYLTQNPGYGETTR
jgi:tetratricopeptide (TPR) repeat protein